MFEIDWFFFAILAALINGLQGFLYKTAAHQKNDLYLVTFSSASISYILAGIMLLIRNPKIGDLKYLFILGTICGVGFIFIMVSRMIALKYLSPSMVFTIFRSNIIIILSLCFILPHLVFEKIPLKTLPGALLIIIAIWILIQGEEKKRSSNHFLKGLGLILMATFISAFLYISQKIAVDIKNIDINSFIFVISLEVAIISMAIIWFKGKMPNKTSSLKNGALIGFYSYFSFMFFLHAVTKGNLSLIVAINSTSFIIPIILSAYFYKEKLTLKKILAVLLTIIGILIIRGKLG
jgi:drug/metabolite transporter (DMT)-like permease